MASFADEMPRQRVCADPPAEKTGADAELPGHPEADLRKAFAARPGRRLTRWTASGTSSPNRKFGSALIAFRWRVERTLAWPGQRRLLAEDHEETAASAGAWIWTAMLRLPVRRLA